MPPDDVGGLPPELAAIGRAEFRAVYEAVTAVALAIVRSKPRADELVHRTFVKLTTTRRWDPSRGALRDHWIGALKSELSNAYKSESSGVAERAAEKFQREVVGREEDPSPEVAHLDRADGELRERGAVDELERLAMRVKKNETLAAVLRCRRAGKTRAADIAAELKLPVEAVYKANEMLRYHLRKLREREQQPASSGEEGEAT